MEPCNVGGIDPELDEYLDKVVEELRAMSLKVDRPRKRARGSSTNHKGNQIVGGMISEAGATKEGSEGAKDNGARNGTKTRPIHRVKRRLMNPTDKKNGTVPTTMVEGAECGSHVQYGGGLAAKGKNKHSSNYMLEFKNG